MRERREIDEQKKEEKKEEKEESEKIVTVHFLVKITYQESISGHIPNFSPLSFSFFLSLYFFLPLSICETNRRERERVKQKK